MFKSFVQFLVYNRDYRRHKNLKNSIFSTYSNQLTLKKKFEIKGIKQKERSNMINFRRHTTRHHNYYLSETDKMEFIFKR